MAYEMPLQDISLAAAGPIIQYRLVKFSGVGVKHTTNLLHRSIGVAQQPGTTFSAASGTPQTMVAVRVFGVTKVEASSGAVALGAILSPTSGAISTGSRLGGTVKTSTAPKTSYVIGFAVTSAAAGTGKRLISMVLTHSGYATTA